MIEICEIVPTSGPKAMVGANLYAMFLREPYEALLEETLPERLARLVERLAARGSSTTSPGIR